MVGTQQWLQSTPTHASGFQLFTVAMTGHAEEWVQLPQHKVADESCCLNAVKESRSENMGLYQYDQMVGCLPDGSMH